MRLSTARRERPFCPSETKIGRFVGGELTEQEENAIRAHVGRCDPCLARLRDTWRRSELTSSSVRERLR